MDYLLGSFIVSYLFLIIVSSKLFPRVFSASRDDGYRLCGVCGLVCRHSGFGGPWARVWPILNQMIEEALIWTLKDSFPKKCTDYVAETRRELFRFITATMMRGLRRANTGTWDLKLRDPVDWESVERKTEILPEMTLSGHHPKVEAQMWKGAKTCVRKKVKKVHTCNSINRSVGVQNRVRIWRTIDSERDTIEESTRVC